MSLDTEERADSPPTISLRADGLVWRIVDKELVLLDLRASKYFSINRSGTRLWQLLAEGTTPARLSRELTRHYGLDPVRAGSDAGRFVVELASRGLLERDPNPDNP